MLTNQRANGFKWLRTAQTTTAEFNRLLQILDHRPRVRERFRVELRSGDVADGDCLTDLAGSNDFADVRSGELEAVYGPDDLLKADVTAGRLKLNWEGPVGADIARRLEYRWNEFPSRTPVSYAVVRVIRATVLVVSAVFTAWWIVTHLDGVSAGPEVLLWSAPALAVIVAAAALWAINRKNSVFVAVRAYRRPFVVARAGSVWRDTKFVVTLVVAVVAALAAVVSAIAAL